jgi:hypothetical protein
LQKIGDTDQSIDKNTLENNSVGVIMTAEGGRPSVRYNVIANNVKGTWSDEGKLYRVAMKEMDMDMDLDPRLHGDDEFMERRIQQQFIVIP